MKQIKTPFLYLSLAFFISVWHLQTNNSLYSMEKTEAPLIRSSIQSDLSKQLEELTEKLGKCRGALEKLACLHCNKRVADFLREPLFDLASFSDEHQIVLLSLVALGQESHLELNQAARSDIESLAERLMQVDAFYDFMGGLIGYHLCCLHLYEQKSEGKMRGVYHKPEPLDIALQDSSIRHYRNAGLSHLGELAEIYPVGGAADRLSKQTKQIAATRLFCGKSLLQRLIEDVQAREYLYAKIYGETIRVPIVMMTSDEKEGTSQIRDHLERENWFGRAPSDFFLMAQPLVPAMSIKGLWASYGPAKPVFKPGGHGVIWKVARDSKALEWLKARGKAKAFVRQINNPIAGVDEGICVFTGYGFEEEKDFGFAACPRAENVSEGVDVVIETAEGYSLTNIEYCDFERYGVDPDTDLLANTNLLFVDLGTVENLLVENPVPGMLINAKNMNLSKEDGTTFEDVLIRLESTMQNLADGLIEERPQQRSFITCNTRLKTISPIKQEYETGGLLAQTPEQCVLDFQANADQLLEACGFQVGEEALFEYHPTLGPFYEVITQKLRRGHLLSKSHLNLEIAEIDVEDLNLQGSLAVIGKELTSGPSEGRCILKNVTIENLGYDDRAQESLDTRNRSYHERCVIVIEKGGEFCAENVMLKGDLHIEVPANTKVTAVMEGDEIKWIYTSLSKPSWEWKYSIDSEGRIQLER